MGKFKRKSRSSTSRDSFSSLSSFRNRSQVASSSGSNLSDLSRNFGDKKFKCHSSNSDHSQLLEMLIDFPNSQEIKQNTIQDKRNSFTSQNLPNYETQSFCYCPGSGSQENRRRFNEYEINSRKKSFQHSTPNQSFSNDPESIKERFSQLTEELIDEIDIESDNLDFLEIQRNKFELSKNLKEHFSKDISGTPILESSTEYGDANVTEELCNFNNSSHFYENPKSKVREMQTKDNSSATNYLDNQKEDEEGFLNEIPPTSFNFGEKSNKSLRSEYLSENSDTNVNEVNVDDFLKEISRGRSARIREMQTEDNSSATNYLDNQKEDEEGFLNEIPPTSFNFGEKTNKSLRSESLSENSDTNVNEVNVDYLKEISRAPSAKIWENIYLNQGTFPCETLPTSYVLGEELSKSSEVLSTDSKSTDNSKCEANFDNFLKEFLVASEKNRKSQKDVYAVQGSSHESSSDVGEKPNNLLNSEGFSKNTENSKIEENIDNFLKEILLASEKNRKSQEDAYVVQDSSHETSYDSGEKPNNLLDSEGFSKNTENSKIEEKVNDFLKEIALASSEKNRKSQEDVYSVQDSSSEASCNIGEKTNNPLDTEDILVNSTRNKNSVTRFGSYLKEISSKRNTEDLYLNQETFLHEPLPTTSYNFVENLNKSFGSETFSIISKTNEQNEANFDDLKDISVASSENITRMQIEDLLLPQETSPSFSLEESLNITVSSESLSTGSKNNLNEGSKRLRAGLNLISKDKSLICKEQNVAFNIDFTRQKKELIKTKIEEVLKWFLTSITQNIPLVFKVRNNAVWSNTIFENDMLKLKPYEDSIFIEKKYTNRNSKQTFNLMLHLLIKNYTLLQTNSYATQREIYYQIKNFVSNQMEIARAMNSISLMLNIEPWYFPIVPTSKGLVFGDLSLIISEEEIIHCNTSSGTLIPQDVTKIREFKSKAYFILVVEKDAIFKKLLDEDIPTKLTRPFIIITGKGFPDTNTRLFVKKLWMCLRIPVFILVDADPDGVNIMLTYRFGSRRMAHVSEDLAIPQIRWLGVFPSEIKKFKITHQILNNSDRNKIKTILERPYVNEKPWLKRELEILKENDMKAEIEGVIKSKAFLTDVYLPFKFFCQDYF